MHRACLGLGRAEFPFQLPGQLTTYRQSHQHAMLQSGFLIAGPFRQPHQNPKVKN
jgi:hypothetical protein